MRTKYMRHTLSRGETDMEKQKKVEVLLGDMEFGEFVIRTSTGDDCFKIALVQRVKEKLLVDADKAGEVGERGLERHDCYLIPSQYDGEVWYSRNAWDKEED